MSSESEQETALKENVRLDAEQFTSLAKEFLKRLGYKRNLHPKKATLEGDRYIVEVELKNKTAKVQIHTKTNEIREFEIEERVGETGFSFSKKTLLLILGVSASIVTIIVLKFMGLLMF
jgi:restriction endonuclease Mrr